MGKRSKEVDAYIAKAEPFARPILKRVRTLFHKGSPKLVETIKWGMPHFEYKGIVGSMAAFQRHVSFGFWKGQVMADPHGLFEGLGRTSMAALKVKDLSEVPPEKVMVAYVKEAVRLNEEEVTPTAAHPQKAPRKRPVPRDLSAALAKNRRAKATFEKFSTTHRNEYVEWIVEAKQEATRKKRLMTSIEWMSEGKPRNWKYRKEWR